MGINASTIKSNTIDESLKVQLYSKDNYEGNIYEIDYGSYTADMFIDQISPDNVFSLKIPPLTTVKLFGGDIYDYGENGSLHITNVYSEIAGVPLLPDHIRGQVRSISITHTDKNSVDNIINTNLLASSNIRSRDQSLQKFGDINSTGSYSNSYKDISVSALNLLPNTVLDNKEGFADQYDYVNFNIYICILLVIILLVFIYNRYQKDEM